MFQRLEVHVEFHTNHCKILILNMCQHVKAQFVLIVIPFLPHLFMFQQDGIPESFRISGEFLFLPFFPLLVLQTC